MTTGLPPAKAMIDVFMVTCNPMSINLESDLADARLGVIDTVRGILLEIGGIDEIKGQERIALIENMGDITDLILEVLQLEVISFDEETGTVTATLHLDPING